MVTSRINIVSLRPETAWDRRDEISDIYRAAFGLSQDQADSFVNGSLSHVRQYEGAEVIAAIQRGRLVGFLYGYTWAPQQWWSQQVGPRLSAENYGHVTEDAFAIAEVAVLPEIQGNGIGTTIILQLLESTRHQFVLLGTLTAPSNAAQRLYRRLGFKVIVSDFRYVEHGDDHLIMYWEQPASFSNLHSERSLGTIT